MTHPLKDILWKFIIYSNIDGTRQTPRHKSKGKEKKSQKLGAIIGSTE